jgi:hypothetical protein
MPWWGEWHFKVNRQDTTAVFRRALAFYVALTYLASPSLPDCSRSTLALYFRQ